MCFGCRRLTANVLGWSSSGEQACSIMLFNVASPRDPSPGSLANDVAIRGSLLSSLQSNSRNTLGRLVNKADIKPVALRLALDPRTLRCWLANRASFGPTSSPPRTGIRLLGNPQWSCLSAGMCLASPGGESFPDLAGRPTKLRTGVDLPRSGCKSGTARVNVCAPAKRLRSWGGPLSS